MSYINLQIQDESNNVIKRISGKDEVNLVYNSEYHEGDHIVLEVEDLEAPYYVQFDDAKGKSLVYLKGKVEYAIPFGEKELILRQKFFSVTDMYYL